MIITENTNMNDSMLFYLSAREAVQEAVELSNIDKKEEIKNFVVNEASDYEILSLLVTGEIPETKYDLAEETLLLSLLKKQIVNNYETVVEAIGEESTKELIFEVGSLSPNYSSAAPIVEFNIAQEAKSPAEVGNTLFSKEKEKPVKINSPLLAKLKRNWGDLKNDINKIMNREKEVKQLPSVKRKIELAKLHIQKQKIRSDMVVLKKKLSAERAASLKGKAGAAATAGKELVVTSYKKGKVLGGKAIATGTAALKAIGNKFGSSGIGKKIASMTGKRVGGAGVGAGLVLGGTAVAALLGYGAVKTFQRFFGQASKACSGKSGAEKTACIKNYKLKALKHRLLT